MTGICREFFQREYAQAVEAANVGFSKRIESCLFNFTGETISPCPLHNAADRKRKNGTSDPMGSAISVSASRDNFASKSSLSASNTEAASLLPPPSPAP